MDYKELKDKIPEPKSNDNLEFVRWQKEMHKCERDLYLALSALLA